MIDLDTLERHAFVNGDTELSELYAKAALLDEIDTEEIKEDAYKEGYVDGKREASDAELLQEVADLKVQVQKLEEAHKAIYTSYSSFLDWLQTAPAQKGTVRKIAVVEMQRQILHWR